MNKYVMLMRNEGTRYIAVWLENTKPCLEPTSPYCIEGGGRKCVLMYTNKYSCNVKSYSDLATFKCWRALVASMLETVESAIWQWMPVLMVLTLRTELTSRSSTDSGHSLTTSSWSTSSSRSSSSLASTRSPCMEMTVGFFSNVLSVLWRSSFNSIYLWRTCFTCYGASKTGNPLAVWYSKLFGSKMCQIYLDESCPNCCHDYIIVRLYSILYFVSP